MGITTRRPEGRRGAATSGPATARAGRKGGRNRIAARRRRTGDRLAVQDRGPTGGRTPAVIYACQSGRSSAGPASISALSPNPGSDRPCRCGHAYVAHQHYRSGSECSICSECPRFRPAPGLVARIIGMLTGRPGAPEDAREPRKGS